MADQLQRPHVFAGGHRHAKHLGRQRIGVASVKGQHTGPLQSGNIGQVGNGTGRLEAIDEIGELSAIVRQYPRARRVLAHEYRRHGAEELFTHQFLRDRKRVGHGVDQRADDVVAIDRQACGRI